MHDAGLVARVEGPGDGGHDLREALWLHGLRGEDPREVLALDQLHDQVGEGAVVAHGVHACDSASVVDLCGELRLALEAGEGLAVARVVGVQDLERDRDAALQIVRAVDHPHAAFAEGSLEAVALIDDIAELEGC